MANSRKRIPTDGGSNLCADNPFVGLQLTGLQESAPTLAARAAVAPAAVPVPKRGRLLLRRLKAGKGGKVVTEISGFEAPGSELQELLRQLQRQLGTGGTVKGNLIELQGEWSDAVRPILMARGFRVGGL